MSELPTSILAPGLLLELDRRATGTPANAAGMCAPASECSDTSAFSLSQSSQFQNSSSDTPAGSRVFLTEIRRRHSHACSIRTHAHHRVSGFFTSMIMRALTFPCQPKKFAVMREGPIKSLTQAGTVKLSPLPFQAVQAIGAGLDLRVQLAHHHLSQGLVIPRPQLHLSL